ncbi:MAG: tetratricopeptide repeat protein [Desulfobacterales bacterium]|nr:tetratricopeptide repeat protein [Desulfobacterales bacterium]
MKKLSFLLLDTDAVALRGFSDILQILGFRDVRRSANTLDGWSMMRLKKADCVVASWNMPEMSGLAMLKIVRSDQNLSETYFYLSRPAFSKADIIEAGRAGVTGLFLKPFNVDNVRDKLKAIAEVEAEPGIVEAAKRLEEGLKLLESGNHGKALSVFELMTTQSESAEVYYNIGYIKTSQGKYDDALIAFQKATRLDRLYARAFEAMGRVYRVLGRDNDAEKCLQKAADIYTSTEKDEYAEQILEEILEINPQTVNVYNSLGVICRKRGDYSAALKYYQKALRIHPRETSIYYNIGRLHIDLKNSQQARVFFEKALEIDPAFKEAKDVIHAIDLGTL